MKIIPLNKNRETFKSKIENIKKYAKYEKFWFDFDNDRPFTKQDYLDFITKIYPGAYYNFNGHEGVKKNQIYFYVYFYTPTKLQGNDISPREIMMFITNTSLLHVFENQKATDSTLITADIIYSSYFTPKRISEFKKLKIIN
tara:strand:- start:9 stop:434 length:426 start_codon:yes stop_codon:yes gene_type:complete